MPKATPGPTGGVPLPKETGVLRFTVPGAPMGKQRARTVTQNGFTRTYTPEATVNAEAWIKSRAIDAGATLLEGPLSLAIVAYFGIPKSWSAKKNGEALQGWIMPTTKPDVDNVTKIVCDSLNGVAYRDDSQIVEATVFKRYSPTPRLEIVVASMTWPYAERSIPL